MYQVGEIVLYSNNGVCRIDSITEMEIAGNRDRFYILKPVTSDAATYFVPCESEQLTARLHPLPTPEELKETVSRFTWEQPIWVDGENQRKLLYRDIMDSGDLGAVFRVYATLELLRQEREKRGKHLRISDERTFHDTERILVDELVTVLGMTRTEALSTIRERKAEE